jgi:hypothetical protein
MSQRAVTAVVSMAARSRSAVNRSTSSSLIPWLHRGTVDTRYDLTPSLKEVEKKGMQRSRDEIIANCQYLDLCVYQLTGARIRMQGRVRIWREGFISRTVHLDIAQFLAKTSLDLVHLEKFF